MRKFAPVCLLLLAFGSAGCTATMIHAPQGSTGRSARAPVNASNPAVGLIKFNAQGTPSALKTRRQDAIRQMSEACGGSYNIDGEGPTQTGGLVVPAAAGAPAAPTGGRGNAPDWYIQFSCTPKGSGGVAAAPEEAVPAPLVPGPRTSPDPR
jgi:hypothetical protein